MKNLAAYAPKSLAAGRDSAPGPRCAGGSFNGPQSPPVAKLWFRPRILRGGRLNNILPPGARDEVAPLVGIKIPNMMDDLSIICHSVYPSKATREAVNIDIDTSVNFYDGNIALRQQFPWN
jgi:hypothetical protein